MVAGLLKVTCSSAGSWLRFGFPVQPVQRGRVSHLSLARHHGQVHICFQNRAALLCPHAPALCPHQDRAEDTSARAGRTLSHLVTPCHPLPALGQPGHLFLGAATLLMGWDFWNGNSKLLCPGLPMGTTLTLGPWGLFSVSVLVSPPCSLTELCRITN